MSDHTDDATPTDGPQTGAGGGYGVEADPHEAPLADGGPTTERLPDEGARSTEHPPGG